MLLSYSTWIRPFYGNTYVTNVVNDVRVTKAHNARVVIPFLAIMLGHEKEH